jgi:hypothetical protein
MAARMAYFEGGELFASVKLRARRWSKLGLLPIGVASPRTIKPPLPRTSRIPIEHDRGCCAQTLKRHIFGEDEKIRVLGFWLEFAFPTQQSSKWLIRILRRLCISASS